MTINHVFLNITYVLIFLYIVIKLIIIKTLRIGFYIFFIQLASHEGQSLFTVSYVSSVQLQFFNHSCRVFEI